MQPLKTTRNEFSAPNLVELVELNAFSIIFGSKVINVTFVTLSAILELCKLCHFQPWGTMHPIKTSRNEFSTPKLVVLDMLKEFISFLVQSCKCHPRHWRPSWKYANTIYHYIFDTFPTFTGYILVNMHKTSTYMGTYLYHRWWVNFPWGGSIFYNGKVTRGSVFYGGRYLIWERLLATKFAAYPGCRWAHLTKRSAFYVD